MLVRITNHSGAYGRLSRGFFGALLALDLLGAAMDRKCIQGKHGQGLLRVLVDGFKSELHHAEEQYSCDRAR
jgi:hypothetical protein